MPTNGDDLTGELRDLDGLAVQEHFLAKWRAGRRPRLSEYARRYPTYAAALAALVAALPPNAPLASADDDAGASAAETSTDSFPGRRWQDDLDAGVGRALATLFGVAATPDVHEMHDMQAREQPLSQVAETPTEYRPGKSAEPEPPEPTAHD